MGGPDLSDRWSSRLCYIALMDPVEIRRLAIKALFSDDILLNQLVLKGGNALNLVHRIGNRSSLDIDFSLEQDFADPSEAQARIFRALEDRFRSERVLVFDENFKEIRARGSDKFASRWGGYEITFKVIEKEKFDELGGNLRKAQIQSLVTGPNQQRTFTVQVSKFEYCQNKVEANLDDYTIYVYTPAMIAFEKLRAICQQMEEYSSPGRKYRIARARDFFDIAEITVWQDLDFGRGENHELVKRIFDAKSVPLDLISLIPRYREFHRPDWPQVQNAVSIRVREFDYYFDLVVRQTELLKPLWIK